MVDQPYYVFTHVHETNVRLNYKHVLDQIFVNCLTHEYPNGTKEPIIYFTFKLSAERSVLSVLEAACVEFERRFYEATCDHAVYLDPKGWSITQLHLPDSGYVPTNSWHALLTLGIPQSHSKDVRQLAEDILHDRVTVRRELRAGPFKKWWMNLDKPCMANDILVGLAVVGLVALIATQLVRGRMHNKASVKCVEKGGVYLNSTCVRTDSIIPM